jgi:AraC-like DNA-binding protein
MLADSSVSTSVSAFGAGRQEHPLRCARQLVDKVLLEQSESVHDLSGQLAMARGLTECVVRTIALRALYSFTNSYSLEEQLRYNALYRWFVGSDQSLGSEVADVSRMTDGLLTRSALAGALLRELFVCPKWRAVERHRLFTPDVSLKAQVPFTAKHVGESARLQGLTDPRLTKARDYIIAHIGRVDLGTNDLASLLCMSRRALYNLCAAYATTPCRLAREVRLERCHAYICNAPNIRKITSIAYDHGFRDYSSFSRMFKSYFGVTPSALRRPSALPVSRRSRRAPIEYLGSSRVLEHQSAL